MRSVHLDITSFFVVFSGGGLHASLGGVLDNAADDDADDDTDEDGEDDVDSNDEGDSGTNSSSKFLTTFLHVGLELCFAQLGICGARILSALICGVFAHSSITTLRTIL